MQNVIANVVQDVITTNLQLWLDAESYSGSGTTWTALQGSNATLLNTPTYSASSPTYFNFDPASSEYATVPNLGSLNRWTIEAWLRTTSSLNSYVTAVVCNQFNLASSLNFSMGTNNAPSNYNLAVGFFDGAWRNTTGFTPTTNTWYHVVGTYNGATIVQYVNAVQNGTTSYVGTPTSGGQVRIAGRWDNLSPPGDFFPGDIAIVRIYSQALNATQVQQNYNAEKERFGL